VWEARKEDRVEGFDYWLNVLMLLTAGSPVLVVQNKADVRIKEIDHTALLAKFGNIAGFYKVSALQARECKNLRWASVPTSSSCRMWEIRGREAGAWCGSYLSPTRGITSITRNT